MIIRLTIAAAAILGSNAIAAAQDFPSQAVTIVSPYQAGGTSDIIIRVLGQKLSERWGQNVVIENKPGASGLIGVNAVLRAPADGHTLLAVNSNVLTINPLVYKKLGYDVDRDLAIIARTGGVANVLVTNPSVPAKTVAELIALLKADPKKYVYASQGIGSNGQVSAEMLFQRAGLQITHIPYRGSSPAVKDLLSGDVHMMFDNLPSVLPLIRAGKLNAIAVTTAERSPYLPETPTIAESGYPGYDTSAWFAILAAKTIPEPLRKRIETDVVEALKSPDVREKLQAAGVTPMNDGSAAVSAVVARELEMWRDVVKRAAISVD